MSDTLAYLDMRIEGCKEDGHDHIGFRLADIENIRASITALKAEVARYDGAEVVAYACHGAGCDVNEDCELISADEAADYEPECVTPLIIKPAKEGRT